jgi:tetratricopeptide (TPR) repeat protein
MNERFLFVASVGYTWVLAHYMTKPYVRLQQLFKMGFLVVCGLYAYQTWTRIPDWSDPFRLNLAAVKVSKNSARINLFTGVSYFNAYQSDQNNETRFENLKIAEKYIDQALTIFPKYGQGLNMKAGVLAEWYKKDNDLPKFLANIEPIIAQKPDLDFVNQYMIYLNKSPQNNAALLPFYIKTGYEILYRKLRRYDFALQYLGWAYTMDIKNAELLFKMATIYDDYAKFGKLNTKEREVQMENARQFYLQAAQLDPKYARQ